MPRKSRPAPAAPALLLAGILSIAATLRAPFTSISPVLDLIRAHFGLSTAAAGALTTLPLLAFAAVSPFAARLARRFGLERALFGALLLIAGGIALRSLGAAWCLYLGTWIVGGGIAVGNVLLPGLLKRDFPDKIASVTGAYAVTMGLAAALASAAAVPLVRTFHFGWQGALCAVMTIPLIAIALWLPQLRRHEAPASGAAPSPGAGLWRSALAWQVTLFLGLNSFVYYVAVSWLPGILAGAGFTAAQAGSLHGLLQLATALPGLWMGPLVNRMKDQRAIAAGVALMTAAAFLGLLLAPSGAALWTVLLGMGTGSTIILGLAFTSLRVKSPGQAAALSGMAQCVGYLLAAGGPTLAGALHDKGGGWTLPLAGCALLSLVVAALGLLAGRALHIAEPAAGARGAFK